MVGGLHWQSTVFRAVKLFCTILEWNGGYMSLTQLSKPMECIIQTVNPNVHCGLGLIMIRKRWVTHCSECNPLVQDVHGEEAVWCVGRREGR